MVVHVSGIDWEEIGSVVLADLGLEKCSNCNQKDNDFKVNAMIYVNKVLIFQASPKFGAYKSAWRFFVMCPICEKGYKFEKEHGRDEVQSLMLNEKSLLSNIKTLFLWEHSLFNESKDSKGMIKLARKKKKTVLDDLSKLGMNALVQELLSAKQKYVEELRLFMDKNKKLGFDIEL